MTEGLNPNPVIKTNTKCIVRDSDIVSKTDATEMLWFKVNTSEGDGWLWCHYMNDKGKKRFENQREARFLLGSLAETGSQVEVLGLGKMKGLIEQASAGVKVGGFAETKEDWEEIFAELDKQGGLSHYALWLNTKFDFAFSDSIATETENGYGMFNNGKDMAYSMDFRGFDLGGYNVYKTKWKFLNDGAGFGGAYRSR